MLDLLVWALKTGYGKLRQWALFRAAGLLDGDPAALPEAPALKQAMAGDEPAKPPPQQMSSVEAWRSDIERLRRRGAGPTAIHDWLRLHGEDYDGSLSAVKRMCAALRRAEPPDPAAVAIPLESEPGEEAQVDFVCAGKVSTSSTARQWRSSSCVVAARLASGS